MLPHEAASGPRPRAGGTWDGTLKMEIMMGVKYIDSLMGLGMREGPLAQTLTHTLCLHMHEHPFLGTDL